MLHMHTCACRDNSVCAQWAAMTRLPCPRRLDSAVVYIDTEMKFSERRLAQIMRHQMQHSAPSDPSVDPSTSLRDCDNLVKRIHVIRPQTGALCCRHR